MNQNVEPSPAFDYLEFDESEYQRTNNPLDWNPCLECNLCVASCPTSAIKADGEFDFFACYNHTYRDSIPGFLDFARDLAEAKPRKFEHRWSDAEIAALWQSLAFRVEYRCFNCVATCPAEIHDAFHSDRAVRNDYFDQVLKPLTETRRDQMDLTGPGGGQWVMTVAQQRCRVQPGQTENSDLTIRCDAHLFLGIHRGERSAVKSLLTGKIKLMGRRELFLAFPRLFPVRPAEGLLAMLGWRLRQVWKRVHYKRSE